MEKRLKSIIVIIFILGLIAINIGVYIHHKNKKQNQSSNNTYNNMVTNTEEQNNRLIETNSAIDTKISNMDESARIRAYYGKFLDAIETEEYEIAYSYLNDKYKGNYFKTQEEFTNYVKAVFPKNKMVVKYNNIERKGEIFTMDVTIYDSDDDNYEPLNQTVVIRENSANNFTLSFSKIQKSEERGVNEY